jgi:hypothetical protein
MWARYGECLDYLLIHGEQHLRQILTEYARHCTITDCTSRESKDLPGTNAAISSI